MIRPFWKIGWVREPTAESNHLPGFTMPIPPELVKAPVTGNSDRWIELAAGGLYTIEALGKIHLAAWTSARLLSNWMPTPVEKIRRKTLVIQLATGDAMCLVADEQTQRSSLSHESGATDRVLSVNTE